MKLLVLISTFHLQSQEIVTLEYDNTGLNYKGTEFKTQGSAPGEYKFNNISIPTIEIYLPKGKAKATTAMIVCPGGGMRSNAFFHEGTHVAKALNSKGIAAFILKTLETYALFFQVFHCFSNDFSMASRGCVSHFCKGS